MSRGSLESRASAGRLLVLAAGLALICGGGAGRPARATTGPAGTTAGFVERVEVDVVDLEVIAVDRDGQPVDDLGRDEFRIFEDDQPVDIGGFARVGVGAVEPRTVGPLAGVSAPVTAAAEPETTVAPPPSHIVVWIDEARSRGGERHSVLWQLGRALTERLATGSRVMVVRYESGAQILLPFTERKERILEALDLASGYLSPLRLTGDRDWIETQAVLREDAREGPCLFGEELARAYADRQRDEIRRTIGDMDQFLDSLEGVSGRKAIFYVGDGLPLRPGEEALAFFVEMCAGRAAAAGDPDATDTSLFAEARFHRPNPTTTMLAESRDDVARRWQRFAARANGQGVSLYGLVSSPPKDTSGTSIELGGAGGASEIVQGAMARDESDGLALLADETGASVVHQGADLPTRLGGAVTDLGRYYSIAFDPRGPVDDRIRRLRVEVTRPDVTLRYRQSYVRKSPERRVADQLITRLLHGVGENPLGIRLSLLTAPAIVPASTAASPATAAAKPAAGGVTRVRVEVPLSALTLLPEGESRRGLFSVFVIVRDRRGGTTPVRRALVPLTVPAADAPGAAQPPFVYEVALSPTAHGLAEVGVALRDELSGATSFLTVAASRGS